MRLSLPVARLAPLALLVLGACRSESTSPPAPPVPVPSAQVTSEPSWPWTTKQARIDLATTKLEVVDANMTRTLDGPFLRPQALAVVNGGFFDTQARPLGLVVSQGKRLSALSPTMSGGVLWIRAGVAHLTASEEYTETGVDFAVQCKPRLVVAGARNIRSDDGKRAARTVLCIREQGRTLEVILTYSERAPHDGPTLFETATKLQADGCEDALALDGGPSTGGVLRTNGSEERVELRGPIRHAIVFTH